MPGCALADRVGKSTFYKMFGLRWRLILAKQRRKNETTPHPGPLPVRRGEGETIVRALCAFAVNESVSTRRARARRGRSVLTRGENG
jgi:hypothetical protein